MKYRFRPGMLATLAMLLVVAVCIRLGLWQQHKAEVKQELQSQLDQRLREAPVTLPQKVTAIESWRYRRVRFTGSYDSRYQILLDNQVEGDVAGYHVITPMRVEDGGPYVLIDRGWIAAPADRGALPLVSTPTDRQEIEGIAWVPGKFFALENPPVDSNWQSVWQNMDMQRYSKAVPFAVHPFVVRLDPQSPAGGFVRNWPKPAERVEMHIGYAYQWFGFALAFVLIYVIVNIRKIES